MQPPTWDAEQYRQRYAFVFHSSQDLVRDWLAPQPGERVLDLGCGTGELSAQMAASGAEVLGIDSVASMIGAARSSHPGVRFEVQDTRQLAFRQECSAVFSNAALYWMKPLPAVFASTCRALIPGGQLVWKWAAQATYRPRWTP